MALLGVLESFSLVIFSRRVAYCISSPLRTSSSLLVAAVVGATSIEALAGTVGTTAEVGADGWALIGCIEDICICGPPGSITIIGCMCLRP